MSEDWIKDSIPLPVSEDDSIVQKISDNVEALLHSFERDGTLTPEVRLMARITFECLSAMAQQRLIMSGLHLHVCALLDGTEELRRRNHARS